MTVDCSECHDFDLVDQEHAVGDQNALASSCITTMMITRGLRRRFCHPSIFNRKEAFCRRNVKAKFTLCTCHGEGLT